MNARSLAERLEVHYTPKHGSWLNIAEIELSTLKRRSLDRRFDEVTVLDEELAACRQSANDARIKLRHLYPEQLPEH